MATPENTIPPPPDYTIPGLRIQKNVNPGPWEMTIRATSQQKDWTLHREKKFYEPMVMDTTIQYDGQFYRIHEEEETPSGWVYRLKAWPRGEIMHRIVELTAEKVAEVQAEKTKIERMGKLSDISVYYEFLLGFLPARIQNKLAERLYFSPEHASRKNALLEFLVFFGLSVLSVAVVLGVKSMSLLVMGWGIYALALEGFVRWAHILGTNEPLGLYILEVADRLWQRLKRK